jgi:hypothetical protein
MEAVVTFNYKKPNKDPILKDLECLNDIGMWITTKVELKISGGFIYPNTADIATIEILLRAYVEQI